MTGRKATRGESVVRYEDRLPVRGRALLPAIAMGAGAGLLVFYVARLFLERTPLVTDPVEDVPDRDAPPAPVRG
jgi:hypothetical protein